MRDEVLYNAVELARFAPNGGNRGAARFVFARDPVLKRQLGAWYLPLWRGASPARFAVKWLSGKFRATGNLFTACK